MPTQVQVRGAVNATQTARTLASRELDIDTTNSRINIHDGSTVGGTPHINWKDSQNQTYEYASASGTNSITITLAKAPAAYAAGQCFTFKAANTTTGAATLNVNSLGALTIKKKNKNGGSIDATAAGDIISGGVYKVHVLDSSNCLLESVDGGGISSVSQGNINSSLGSISCFSGTSPQGFTLPGGQYGFYPQIKVSSGTGTPFTGYLTKGSFLTTSYATTIAFDCDSSATIYAQQRYVTASPPFNMGDGDVQGFIFARVDKAGNILGHYAADVPPWAYNGPTNITADYQHPVTGKKYRRVPVIPSAEETFDCLKSNGTLPPLRYELEEITHEIKNRDMALIPHPFVGMEHESVVLLDPMCPLIGRIIELQNAGHQEEADELFKWMKPDNTPLKRKGPNGVIQCKYKLKKP